METKKEKKFEVSYSFDGRGYCVIKAKNKKEAVELFYQGNFSNCNDDASDNYMANEIKIIK